MRPRFRLIQGEGGEQRLFKPPEALHPYPPEILELTDRLHDAGFYAIAHAILQEHAHLQTLVAAAGHMLEPPDHAS